MVMTLRYSPPSIDIIENIVSIEPGLMEAVVTDTSLIPYLLRRLRIKPFDSVREYVSELLSILVQTSRDNRLALLEGGGGMNGVDILLQVVAGYKRKDPKEEDEVGMMENVFNVLRSVVQEPEGKSAFVEGEGVELMIMMLK